MTFGFLVGSRNFITLFWVSWEVFVLPGEDCNHWVAKSCTTTAYRWLLRDSLPSLSILWSAVIKSPKCFALGTAVPARLLQDALVIFVFKQISMCGSLAFSLCHVLPCITLMRFGGPFVLLPSFSFCPPAQRVTRLREAIGLSHS